ncbi:hypothetical protein ACLMJK_002831 [Lecanora helva]
MSSSLYNRLRAFVQDKTKPSIISFSASIISLVPHFDFGTTQLDVFKSRGSPKDAAQRLWALGPGITPITADDRKNELFAATATNKLAAKQLGVKEDQPYSWISHTADSSGHVYLAGYNALCDPGLTAQAVKNKRNVLELFKGFPVPMLFVTVNTADGLSKMTLNDRVNYVKSQAGMEKLKEENDNILALDDIHDLEIVIIVNGIDIIYVKDVKTTVVGGMTTLSFLAGTSSEHGLCGTLEWSITWQDALPNNLLLRFYGTGQSYASFVDWSNNLFAQSAFSIMGKLFEVKINKDKLRLSYPEYSDYVRTFQPKLWNQWTWLSISMLQFFQYPAAVFNYLLRKKGQLNAADEANVRAILAQTALVVQTSSTELATIIEGP